MVSVFFYTDKKGLHRVLSWTCTTECAEFGETRIGPFLRKVGFTIFYKQPVMDAASSNNVYRLQVFCALLVPYF
jgi:dissimilatory sulfite reductase (desulfoviridin) alpha/beta subunit